MVLVDGYGRPLLNLRIALTKPCNLHCSFCHAEGEDKTTENSEEMTAEEVVRIAKMLSSLGISRIKLTGGEPLIRKGHIANS
jgi:cyclic pyranopterin phosphate synthase